MPTTVESTTCELVVVVTSPFPFWKSVLVSATVLTRCDTPVYRWVPKGIDCNGPTAVTNGPVTVLVVVTLQLFTPWSRSNVPPLASHDFCCTSGGAASAVP